LELCRSLRSFATVAVERGVFYTLWTVGEGFSAIQEIHRTGGAGGRRVGPREPQPSDHPTLGYVPDGIGGSGPPLIRPGGNVLRRQLIFSLSILALAGCKGGAALRALDFPLAT